MGVEETQWKGSCSRAANDDIRYLYLSILFESMPGGSDAVFYPQRYREVFTSAREAAGLQSNCPLYYEN